MGCCTSAPAMVAVGATNTARVLGKAAGLLTLLLDIGKGALGVYLGMLLDSQDKLLFAQVSAPAPHSAMVDPVWACAGGMLALFGHCFSPFLRFKGGKGVATAAGGLVVLMPVSCLVGAVVWVLTFLISRYVSLGSILAAVAVPVTSWIRLALAPEPSSPALLSPQQTTAPVARKAHP